MKRKPATTTKTSAGKKLATKQATLRPAAPKKSLRKSTTPKRPVQRTALTPRAQKAAPAKAKKAAPTKTKPSTLAKLLERQRALLRPAKAINPVIPKTLQSIAKALPDTTVIPGGSFAKGTSLRNSHDVDVFVQFPKGTQSTVMSERLRQAFPKATVMHGSRDYLQLRRGGIVFEIVPVQIVTTPADISNVTDMSPLHVAYVQSHLSPQQKDDVRLLKQFCKAAGVYGAESHVRGFSGYVLELLIAQYGSFTKFLAALPSWEGRVFLDPAKAFPSKEAAMLRLNESKLGPLVLVDPLDAERNAAAAVSIESILLLQERAAQFLGHPTASAFDTAVYPAKIRAAWKPAPAIFVRCATPQGRQDIVGSKVLAGHERAIASLAASEFPLLHTEWRFGPTESVCWYILASNTLPKTKVQRGPPNAMADAVQAFQAAHRHAFERDGRWYAHVPRTHTEADAAIRAGWQGFRVRIDSRSGKVAQKGRKEQKR